MANNLKFSLLAIEAKDLFASDSNGFSDPYLKIPHRQNGVIDIPGKKNRTQTIKKTLNPVWNHNFDVEFNPQICTKLNIEVYDYDTFGSDDLIGSGSINLDWMRSQGQDTFDGWIPLYITSKDKKTKVAQNIQKGSVHVKLQVKYRPNIPMGPMPGNAPTVQQMITQPQMNQSMPPQKSQPVPSQMSQPPINIPNMYPKFSQNPQQAPMGQPSNQPSNHVPMGQPPIGQPPIGQPPNQPPMGQPPMGQPPNQPPMGQPPNQPPIGQPPIGQPPSQPPIGQPPIGQPPSQPPIGQPPIGQPRMGQPPMGQPPNQPPMGQPPNQPPMGQPPNQPPIGQPPNQPPMGQPPNQPPIGQPPNQPPMGQPPNQPPMGQPPNQPPMGQPPNQPPIRQPPMGQPPNQPPIGQPPMGQPPNQPPIGHPPMGQPPNQPPMGQPPIGQPPMGQPPIGQPPMGQPPMGQPPIGQPPIGQPPIGQPPMGQPPMGQPPYQPPIGQPPIGQPPNQPPMGQPPIGPQSGSQAYNQPPISNSMVPPHGQPPYTQQQPISQPAYPQNKTPIFNGQIPSQPNMPYGPNPYAQQQGYNSQQSAMPPHYPQQPGYGVPPHYTAPPSYGVPPHYGPPPQYTAAPHYAPPPVNRMIPTVQPAIVMAPPVISISPHINGQPFQPGMWIEIVEPSVMVGLGWDFTGGETFDLDASVTGFDYNYNVIEAVYFNNKRGMNNSVIHFGDNTTGIGQGDDELIQVDLSRVPQRVYFLAVTINSFKKNSLIRARSAYIRLFTQSYILGKYTLNRTKDCIGLLLGVFERNPTKGTWYFRVMADPISGNKVTLSIGDIKTLLGAYSTRNMGAMTRRIVHPLPGEPLIEFNKWIQLPNRFTYIGLGWNIQQGFNYDLDASVITFDRMNNLLEIVFHKNMDSYNHSIIHYGDNRVGVGEGDDEILSIDFGHVDPNTFTMVVVVNSFKGNSLSNVFDAFIRLYDTTHPIGVSLLNNAPNCTGLCFGIFRKHTVSGLWYFCAVKEIVQGIEAPQSVRDVIGILGRYPLKV